MSESQAPYYFSEDIDTLDVNPYFKELYKSFTGKIDKSPEQFELPLQVTRYHALNETDSTYFYEFEHYSAYDEILELADKHKVTLINEDHFNPYHRLYTTTLLDSLYKLGYRYLFAEAIKNSEYCDSLVNTSYIPIDDCGVYIKHPAYANLLRRAIDIGYTVLSFETTNRDSIRDKEMAKNIIRKSTLSDSSKALIYCGFAHNIENYGHGAFNQGKRKWLAYYLKTMLNMEVLTVNQTELTAIIHER